MYQVQQQDIERKVEFVSIPQRIILQKIQTKKITPDHKKFQVENRISPDASWLILHNVKSGGPCVQRMVQITQNNLVQNRKNSTCNK